MSSDNRVDIWMPLNISKYLGDTSRLTTEQHGAYLLLIMDYWMKGAPPDKDSVLAAITKLSLKRWRGHKNMLQDFFNLDSGRWVHKRIEKELALARENKAKSSEKAAKAAKARWKPDAPSNATSNARGHAPDMLEQCPKPEPKPEPKPVVSPNVDTTTNLCSSYTDSGEVAAVCVESPKPVKIKKEKSPVYSGCEYFRLSESELALAQKWYRENAQPLALLPHAVAEVEKWLADGRTARSLSARKAHDHKSYLYDEWILNKAKARQALLGGGAVGAHGVRVDARNPHEVQASNRALVEKIEREERENQL